MFLLRQLFGVHFVAIGPTPVSELIPACPDARHRHALNGSKIRETAVLQRGGRYALPHKRQTFCRQNAWLYAVCSKFSSEIRSLARATMRKQLKVGLATRHTSMPLPTSFFSNGRSLPIVEPAPINHPIFIVPRSLSIVAKLGQLDLGLFVLFESPHF